MGAKFDKLSSEVAKGYKKKGMSAGKAKAIGNAVAGKIAREKGEAPGGANYKGKKRK